jgi:hypothetical protein
MYQYDHYDQTLVDERVAQFRGQVQRYLAGELTDDEFRPLRLMNGLYLQRHAPMLRVAIPYGLLSARQLRTLAHIARRYDQGLRPFHHPPEHSIQLAEAGRDAGYSGGTGASRDARHSDQRQLHSQCHCGSSVRRRPGRNRRPAHLLRNHSPVVHLSPGIFLPAAQVQNRGDRGCPRPRCGSGA